MKIYLDVCCLNRPFDDQAQDRIHLESEAIITILKHIESGEWDLVNSDAIMYEVSKIYDIEKREKVFLLLSKASIYLKVDEVILARAKEIREFGIKTYDALHVAIAETGKVDIFLTTDDNLLYKLKKHINEIKTKVDNPLEWIKEVI